MFGRHAVILGAPRDMLGGPAPALLQRNDDDFVESTLDDLRSSAGRQRLEALRVRTRDGALRLYQPVQRVFHLAVIEAWCDVPGNPRLDPAQVLGAGLVLRRAQGSRREGWMRSNGRLRGWLALDRIGGADADPAADARLQRALSGVAALDDALGALARENADSALQEAVIALYLAPPDVCQQAGKTLFYGVVPTASSEQAETGAEFLPAGDDSFGAESPLFVQHLAAALRGERVDFPFAGATLKAGWCDVLERTPEHAPAGVTTQEWEQLSNPLSTPSSRLRALLTLLRQLGSEFNAFEDDGRASDLVRELQALRLPLQTPPGAPQRDTQAWDFLRAASAVLLARESAAPIEMPLYWPALPAAHAKRLATALHAALQARFQAMQSRSGRYDDARARYVLRAFVRVKGAPGCPPRLAWSAESAPLAIAPWYESDGSAPPLQIPLPDPADRGLLKALRPNVAFVVPPSLHNLLSGKATDLLKGQGGIGGPGLAWVCSFNIPIITLCAFIVLNVFLSLLNLVFGWMFFVKLCLPLPKLGNKPPEAP